MVSPLDAPAIAIAHCKPFSGTPLAFEPLERVGECRNAGDLDFVGVCNSRSARRGRRREPQDTFTRRIDQQPWPAIRRN